jgi:hypothetical protein
MGRWHCEVGCWVLGVQVCQSAVNDGLDWMWVLCGGGVVMWCVVVEGIAARSWEKGAVRSCGCVYTVYCCGGGGAGWLGCRDVCCVFVGCL